MASSGEKSLAVGHVSGFQIDPRKIKQYLSVEKPASSEEKNAVWARIYHIAVAAACGADPACLARRTETGDDPFSGNFLRQLEGEDHLLAVGFRGKLLFSAVLRGAGRGQIPGQRKGNAGAGRHGADRRHVLRRFGSGQALQSDERGGGQHGKRYLCPVGECGGHLSGRSFRQHGLYS